MFRLPSIRIPRFGRFKSLLGKEPYLGVDIGTTSIKIAEISPPVAGQELRLSNYSILQTFGYLDRFNNALQSSSLKLLENETADLLKIMIEKGGFQSRSVIASLPSFYAFTTLIELPQMADSEIANIMKLQAKQYIPLSIDQVTIDWAKVGERRQDDGTTKMQVLLISVVNEQVERYQKIFKLAGLNLEALEIEGISLARVLARDEQQPVLIIDIGSRSTAISVAERGLFKYGGQTDFSGGSLTQVIANALSISPRRAEDVKKRKGLNVSGGERELSTLMEPALDVIISEAKRVVKDFEGNYAQKITSIILSGGGANLIGIEEYFGKQFEMPIRMANPFSGMGFPRAISPIIKKIGPLLAVAVGLGVKELRP